MIRAAIVFAGALFWLGGIASAQDKHSFALTAPPDGSKYLQQHIIDVGDVPGHQIRVLKIQRVYQRDQLKVVGARLVEILDRGMSDYTNGVGPVRGSGVWTLDSGERIFNEWQGTSESQLTPTGSKKGTYHGIGRFTGETGKFKNIHGTFAAVTEFDRDPKSGYNRTSVGGEYWLEE